MRGRGSEPTVQQRYEAAMRKLAGPPPWSVLVALSGGADSTALLLAATVGGSDDEGRVRACFVNHGSRGDEDARAERFCEEVCSRLDAELDARRVRVQVDGRGFEDAARRVRYEALESARQAASCDWILTGHTADDTAETVLMRLARGASSRGLGGIPERNGVVLRPLLRLRRLELREWLTGQDLLRGLTPEGSDGPWLEDSTNEDPGFLRNKIRADVLPALEAAVPQAVDSVAAAASLLREDDDYLDSMAREVLAKSVVQPSELAVAVRKGLKVGAGARAWSAEQLQILPGPLKRRAVRAALIEAGVPGDDLASKHIVLICGSLDHNGFALDLPGGLVAAVRRGLLVLEERPG